MTTEAVKIQGGATPRSRIRLPYGLAATAIAAAAAALCLAAAPALAQSGSAGTMVHVSPDGDVTGSEKTHSGPFQLGAGVTVGNSDYFRGRFDGVPDDFDELRISPELRGSLEFWREGENAASFTVGSSNSIWTEDVVPEDSTWGNWYESNNYAGLAGAFGGFRTGLTYTRYGSPNDTFGTSHEVALSAGYADPLAGLDLDPTFTVAVPVDDDGEGAFTKFQAKVLSLDTDTLGTGMTFTVPVIVGVGWSDYYGPTTDTTGYAETGLDVGIPLDESGRWSFNAGVHAIAREDDLADSDPAVAGDDTMAYQGLVSIDFTY